MVQRNAGVALCFGLMLFIAGSCQSKKTPEIPEVPAPVFENASYPPLGNAELNRLYANAEKVDIIFYNLPVSINQDDAPSAKNTALYVSPTSPTITKNCQPLGRLTWVSKGAILKEADLYCEEGCRYFLFMENNKPTAANAMVPAGIDFFNGIISQVSPPKK